MSHVPRCQPRTPRPDGPEPAKPRPIVPHYPIPDADDARFLGVRLYPRQGIVGLFDVISGNPIAGTRNVEVVAIFGETVEVTATFHIAKMDTVEVDNDATTKPEAG